MGYSVAVILWIIIAQVSSTAGEGNTAHLNTMQHNTPGTKHRWTVRSHWTPEHFSLRTASMYL